MSNPGFPRRNDHDQPFPPRLPDANSASFGEQLRLPTLATAHVLTWLGLTCVLSIADYAMSALEASEMKRLYHLTLASPWWMRGVHLLSIAAFAACLVASGVLIRSRYFRGLGSLQPGHWMVMLIAIEGILKSVARPFGLIGLDVKSGHGWGANAATAITWLSVLLVGILYLFAAVRLHDAKRWRLLLALCAANVFQTAILLVRLRSASFQFWSRFYLWFLPSWQAGLIVVAILTVILDWRRRASRDWAHWLGVSTWVLGNLLGLIASLRAIMVALSR